MPRLPRETKVDVRLCHACHAKCRGVTRDQGTPKPDQSAPRSAMSATPATRNEGGCKIVPRLPRDPSAPRSAMSATPATRNEGGCEIVPRLPRETKVDVRLCHACHAKCRGVTRDQGAPKPDPSAPRSARSATPATRNEGGCEIVCVKLLYVRDGM